MYWGYMNLGGVELVNHARFDTYMTKQLRAPWFFDPDDNGDLALGLGFPNGYNSPLVDDAPWVDANDPASQRFYGCYVIGGTGFGDSTRTANVTQSMYDGGTVAGVRRATGQFTLKLLLAAGDEVAMESGVTWLRNALDRANCIGGCPDDELSYLLDVPVECYTFDPDNGAGSSLVMPPLDPASSPFTISERHDSAVQYSVLWQPTPTDGALVQWGTDLEHVNVFTSPQVYLQRTNLSPNPSFEVDTSSWSATTGDLDRVGDVGIDGGWAMSVASDGEAVDFAQALPASNQPRAWSISLNPTVDLTGTVTVSWTGGSEDYPFTLLADRYDMVSASLPANVGAITVEVTASSDADFTLLADQQLIEHGTQVLTFFDASEDAPAGYSLTWLGAPGLSASRLLYTDVIEVVTEVNPNVLITSWFSVVSGSIPGGGGGTGYLFASADQWMDNLTRTVLGVTATGGPTLDQALNTRGCGSARIYDIVLTTEIPYAFAEPVDVPPNGMTYPPDTFDDRGRDAVENLALNPRGIATGTAWVLTAGTGAGPATLTYQTNGPYGTSVGVADPPPSWLTTAARLAWSTPPTDRTAALGSPSATTVIPGEQYTALVYGAYGTIATGTYTVRAVIRWFDSTGAFISTSNGPDVTLINNGTGAMTRLKVTATAPAGAAYGVASVGQGSAAVLPVSGNTLYVTGAMLVAGDGIDPTTGENVPYVDGDMPATLPQVAAWEDTANASPSYLAIPWNCDSGVPTPVVDPDCPPIPAPPRPPVITLVCSDDDDVVWERYWIDVPKTAVASSATSVPVLTLSTESSSALPGKELRSVRVRMHPNPFNYEPDQIDPCSFCAEFVVSYLPAEALLTMDGRRKQATINVAASGDQIASTLLFGSDGMPMTWPEMSCGVPYVMTVDLPQGSGFDPDFGAPIRLTISTVRRE